MSYDQPKFTQVEECVDCLKTAPVDDEYLERCEPCWNEESIRRGERAWEAFCSDFYRGDTPVTVEEQYQAAATLTRGLK